MALAMLTCQACQRSLPDDACFCGYCGFRVDPIEAASSSKPRAVVRLDPAPAVSPALEHELGAAETVRASQPIALLNGDLPDPAPARRQFQRHLLCVEVTYSSAHNFYVGASENISEGGIFIATHTPAALGSLLRVTFVIPGSPRPHTVPCEVRWVRTANACPGLQPGMGLRFLHLDEEAAAAVTRFVAHRVPLHAEE